FIWEWYDQGLKDKGEDGQTIYCYGGDYGDEPNNGNFCVDGLLRPDGHLSTGLLNYKQVIAPLVLKVVNREEGEFALRSKRYFRDSSDTLISYRVWSGEKTLLEGSISDLHVEPQCKERFTISEIPALLRQQENEYSDKDAMYIDFRILYKEDNAFAKQGEEVSAQQFVLREESYYNGRGSFGTEIASENASENASLSLQEDSERKDSLEKDKKKAASLAEICVKESKTGLCFSNENFALEFNKVNGKLEKLSYDGKAYITSGPVLNMLRAHIDNDMYKVKDWKEKYFIHKQQEQLESIRYQEEPFGYSVFVHTHFSALSMAFGFKGEYSYRIYKDGAVELELSMKGFRYSSFAPEFIPRIGVELRVSKKLEELSWYGLGPNENYPDMQDHARIGIYEKRMEEMHENYVMPQENGHRGETRWITLLHGEEGFQIVSKDPIGFDAHDYTIEALEKAKHWGEIRKSEEIILHLDAKHSGVGSNSCGEEQIYRNKTRFNDYRLQLLFQKIEKKEAFSAYRRARERSYE
ncbi:beta-galactosidase small subunit-related protein, partial [Oribacterium parvum]